MPPIGSFRVKSMTDWIQALFPTLVVLASLAYGMGKMDQRLVNIESMLPSIDEVSDVLHDQNVEIVIIKKDLSTLEYKIESHIKETEVRDELL